MKDLNYDSLQCVGDEKKEKVIVEEIKPDVMFEDHPVLIEAFYKAGIPVLYPDWHQYTNGMESFGTPFSSWSEIPGLLKTLPKSE